MASNKSKVSSAKSLPDLHRIKIMPGAAKAAPRVSEKPPITVPRARHKNSRKPPILPYREDQYSSKVLTGTWEERRNTDNLPKVPFQDAYMLDRVSSGEKRTEVSTYQKNYLPGRSKMDEAINESYKKTFAERVKNKTVFDSEAKEDVYHPRKDTPQHDQGAAWHTLYHQSYTLGIPKANADQVHLAAIGSPEIKFGLWEKHLAKWAKIEADQNVLWKSTYQMGYPTRTVNKLDTPDERKFIRSLWRTDEGCLVIGNPHQLEIQKEVDLPARDPNERLSHPSSKTKHDHHNV